MELHEVDFRKFEFRPWELLAGQGMVLCAGDHAEGKFNAMVVGWGGIGFMWNRPFVQVVVRPTRFTFGFMNSYPTFTLSAFGPEWADAVGILGSKSGRDGDKITESGLHAEAAKSVAAPCFAEASLVLECRTSYWDDLDPERFLDPHIARHYPDKDWHRVYFGEILKVRSLA